MTSLNTIFKSQILSIITALTFLFIACPADDETSPDTKPKAVDMIDAVTLNVGSPAATVDVASAFTDEDTLTYTAVSADTSIATVAVSASTVTITPVAEGTATITVTATDTASQSATQTIDVTVRAVASLAITAPATLDEASLDGATLTLTLMNADYTDPLTDVNLFALTTVPEIMGLTVMGVSRTDANNAMVTLAYTGDFDVPATLSVTVVASAHDGAVALTTATVPITAVLEPTVAITARTLSTSGEASLDRATLTLTLMNATYADPISAGQFTLTTAPAITGLTVMGVSRTDANNTILTLAHDGSDFDADATLSVTVAAGAHSDTTPLTTAPVKAADRDGDEINDIDDVDDDNDGLIEIRFLEDLDNMRYDLGGTSYKTNASDPGNTTGAPAAGLNGYELARNLDFGDDTSYADTANKDTYTIGEGWTPIGDNSTDNDATRFTATLDGNGNAISNLHIARDTTYVGFFGYIGTGGAVRNLGLAAKGVDYTGTSGGSIYIGILVGRSFGIIASVHTHGDADGGAGNTDHVGGLVGQNNGTIVACYATGDADGGAGNTDRVGGLVGQNNGTIVACYATGDADDGGGNSDGVGGLVGFNNNNSGMITSSYATGDADGGDGNNDFVGGLVGFNAGTTTASYGFGMTMNGETPGGIDRSFGDTSDASAVPDASALTMMNSSTDITKRWSARVWDFGDNTQPPILKWITGFVSGGATDEAKYPCDQALLPTGATCLGIIPGQGR